MSTSANDGPASVRHVVMTAAAVAAVLTLGLILYILVVPARTALVLRWYLLFVGAIGVIVAIRVMAARYPVLWRSSADRVKDQPTSTSCPADTSHQPSSPVRLGCRGFRARVAADSARDRRAAAGDVSDDRHRHGPRGGASHSRRAGLDAADAGQYRNGTACTRHRTRRVRAAVEKLEELGASPHA